MEDLFNITDGPNPNDVPKKTLSMHGKLLNSIRALEPGKHFDVLIDGNKGTRRAQIKQASLHGGIQVATECVMTTEGEVFRVTLKNNQGE